MKYVITWHERPAASFRDYEAAQERILGIFKDWQMPATIQQFVVRIGEFGGYMIVETANQQTYIMSQASLRLSNSKWNR
jgi:hypothetical protein